MRQFASSGFRIWNLSREAKLVYTGFGLFALLAISVSILFYEDLVGPQTGGVRAYYAGDAPAPAVNATQPTGGPKLDLPNEPEVRLNVAVTYRKLLEVTHFHLFTVPVFLLIIAHLFMLTGLSTRAKSIWIAGGWLSSLLHLLAPWLIRYGSAAWSFLYPISGGAMALTLGVMTVYPMWAMWTGGNDE
jgi:hypothetical protein